MAKLGRRIDSVLKIATLVLGCCQATTCTPDDLQAWADALTGVANAIPQDNTNMRSIGLPADYHSTSCPVGFHLFEPYGQQGVCQPNVK